MFPVCYARVVSVDMKSALRQGMSMVKAPRIAAVYCGDPQHRGIRSHVSSSFSRNAAPPESWRTAIEMELQQKDAAGIHQPASHRQYVRIAIKTTPKDLSSYLFRLDQRDESVHHPFFLWRKRTDFILQFFTHIQFRRGGGSQQNVVWRNL